MKPPRWTRALLRLLAQPRAVDDVIGDLEEAHRTSVERRGRFVATVLTAIGTLDMAFALMRARLGRSRVDPRALVTDESERGLIRMRFSWLDVKLGVRMLIRYPGLTVVGGLAMAFAIWVGAAVFEFSTQLVYPNLPLDEGDRIVGFRHWNVALSRTGAPSLHDFDTWRRELRSVEDLGAFRTRERNLITGRGVGEPIPVAEISGSAFRVTRVPPLLGRSLVRGDEDPGSPRVVVIGFGVWQSRFGSDPDIVGRTVRLGRAEATVVGVMPEGYAFPVAQDIWIPLRLNPLDYERAESPPLGMFGRLAPGVDLTEAQAELAGIGLRTAADYPETHEHLRPQVVSYPRTFFDPSGVVAAGVMSTTNLFIAVLLVLMCGNVALLMYARAATREREIVVRNALGATRSRIVGQLFAEALVLGVCAAVIGVSAAGLGLRWGLSVVQAEVLEGRGLPFWINDTLSLTTVVYAVGLTLLGAILAGVLPALKVTGSGTLARLQRAGVGGASARFGPVWTTIMVLQISATVVFIAVAAGVRADVERIRGLDSGFEGTKHLSVRLQMDREMTSDGELETAAVFAARYQAALDDLEERLTAEQAVLGVTLAERLPRMYHPWRQIEVEGGSMPPPDERGHRMGSAAVDTDFFEVLGESVTMGRAFDSGDIDSDYPVVVVNEPFVSRVLGGRNPIGRRLRYVATEEYRDPDQDPGAWHEIVGVVPDLGATSGYGPVGFYHPRKPGEGYPVHMAVHVGGDPAAFGPTLRAAAVDVDPTLRLSNVLTLDQVNQGEIVFYDFWFGLTATLSAVALLLSLTGIYSVMSFIVARRTREIGIRVALGSGRGRIVLAIFRRPVLEVALGVLLGATLVGGIGGTGFGISPGLAIAAVSAYASVMFGVCMLACIVPTRRALAIEPTDALRAEG